MKQKRLLIVVLLLITSLFIAACDNDGDNGGSDPEDTGIELSESFSSTSEETGVTLTVNFPEGWVVGGDVDNGVTVANNQEVIDAQNTIPDGGIGVLIIPLPAEMGEFMGIQEGMTLTEVMNLMIGTMTSSSESPFPALGEASETTIGGNAAATATGSDEDTDAVIYMMQLNGVYVFAAGITDNGLLGDNQATIQAIVESVSVSTTSE